MVAPPLSPTENKNMLPLCWRCMCRHKAWPRHLLCWIAEQLEVSSASATASAPAQAFNIMLALHRTNIKHTLTAFPHLPYLLLLMLHAERETV